MFSSFFSRSALNGPTPFRYSIGLSNMEGADVMFFVYTKIKGIAVVIMNKNYRISFYNFFNYLLEISSCK